METNLVFRVVLPVLIATFIIHRGFYTARAAQKDADSLKERNDSPVTRLAGALGLVGLAATIIQVVRPDWIGWAQLPFPAWLRWFGVSAALLGFVLLQWAQVTLGRNWSDTPRMIRGQALVTSGPYRWIRHPIYTAFLLILGATLFISANWLIGFSWTGMTALEILSRIEFEERLMLEYFGDQYRQYMNQTGRLLPKFI